MNIHELGDEIAESMHRGDHAQAPPSGPKSAADAEGFRRRAAIFVGVMGMLLAIASLGGEYNMKETINSNILASDTYAFYQARNMRQTSYRVAADQLEELLASLPDLPNSARATIEKGIASYKLSIDHLESDPQSGNGKKELLAKAQHHETARDVAQSRDINFDFARAIYEIAIVLGSVSIVGASRPLLWLCGMLATAATLLSLNGFLLFAELPFH